MAPLSQQTISVPVTSAPMSESLQQRLERVSQQFSAQKKPEPEADDDNLTVNTSSEPKSYSKRKPEIIDDEEELEPETPEAKRQKLDENPDTDPPAFQSSYVEVQDEVSDLKDEDIIESTGSATADKNGAADASADAKTTGNGEQDTAILNALLQDENSETVKVEAQPAGHVTGNNMSPEQLTAISGQNSPEPEKEQPEAPESADPDAKKWTVNHRSCT